MSAPARPHQNGTKAPIPKAATAPPGEARDGCSLSYRGKRLLDLILVGVFIVPASVICVVAALVHLLSHGRPMLFRQQRVGRDGRQFVILKLRTMQNLPTGPGGTDSVRVTRVGRVLRRWSLDELPQLVNVLRGEISLVGPRPTLAYQVHRYSDRQRLRLRAAPGLTGLAQIRGRQCLGWPERIEWDLCYLSQQSLRLDLAILFLTIWTVLARDGATASHDGDPIASTA